MTLYDFEVTSRFRGAMDGGAGAIDCKGIKAMKLVLILLGVVLLVVAGVYFVAPADQLPGFLPGHEAGSTHMHTKHGIVSAAAGVVLLAAGLWMGRR